MVPTTRQKENSLQRTKRGSLEPPIPCKLFSIISYLINLKERERYGQTAFDVPLGFVFYPGDTTGRCGIAETGDRSGEHSDAVGAYPAGGNRV